MRSRPVFLLAISAVVLAYVGTQVALAPESDALPILPTPDFSELTAYPVVRVVDGDTIVVDDKGKDIKVRLVGVDTPETVHPTKPVEHYGKEASRFTTNLLKGEKVYLVGEPLPGALDRYGRTLAYVYRVPDGLFVNAEIIRQGYGHAYTQIPSKYMQEFKQLEQFARKAEKGLWASVPPEQKKQSSDVIATFSGSGGKNTRPFSVPAGWEIQWDAKGDIFQLYLYKADGSMVGVAANQPGPGKGSSYQAKAGKYYLQVNALDKWSIKIVKLK